VQASPSVARTYLASALKRRRGAAIRGAPKRSRRAPTWGAPKITAPAAARFSAQSPGRCAPAR